MKPTLDLSPLHFFQVVHQAVRKSASGILEAPPASSNLSGNLSLSATGFCNSIDLWNNLQGESITWMSGRFTEFY